jgi:hypothetical protein
MERSGAILGQEDLGPSKEDIHVAWSRNGCSGFVGSGRGVLYRVDASGEFRRAHARSGAHFLFGLDTVPEVRQWWEDDALLPKGREPDITVLPAPSRIFVPDAIFRWIAEFFLSLLAGWLSSIAFVRLHARWLASREIVPL